MAVQVPVVLVNGHLQRLQAGDTISGVAATADDISLVNGSGATLDPGAPVYVNVSGQVLPGRANAVGTVNVIGLMAASTASSASGTVRKDGTLTLTTGQWDTVAGTTGGLTPGTEYWLSAATAGRITSTVPTTGFVLRIGIALSSTDLEIILNQWIQL